MSQNMNDMNNDDNRAHQPNREASALQRSDTEQAMTDSPTRQFSLTSTVSIPGATDRSNEVTLTGGWSEEPARFRDSPPTGTGFARSQMYQQQQPQAVEQSVYNPQSFRPSSQSNNQTMQGSGNTQPTNDTRSAFQNSAAHDDTNGAPQNRQRPVIHQNTQRRSEDSSGANGANRNTQPNGIYRRTHQG